MEQFDVVVCKASIQDIGTKLHQYVAGSIISPVNAYDDKTNQAEQSRNQVSFHLHQSAPEPAQSFQSYYNDVSTHALQLGVGTTR